MANFLHICYNELYSFNSLPSTKAVLNAVSNVYNIVYPVSVFSVEEIEVYSNIHFDYLIIYDSLNFTDAELAYFISMYPNVIFVKHSVEDLRLKDIPLIGGLFGSSSDEATQRERLLLITPRILDLDDINLPSGLDDKSFAKSPTQADYSMRETKPLNESGCASSRSSSANSSTKAQLVKDI